MLISQKTIEGKPTRLPMVVRQLVTFYDHKTQEILRRYGPGPRVHYHTGLVDKPPSPYASHQKLHDEVIAAQERMLQYAAKLWDANTGLSGDVLDVGCGLGGGAIFWAQEFGAHVTAITIVPSHIELVGKFAAEAGMASKVRAMLCDASAVPGENRFDAAVAIDSSSSFPADRGFRRLATLFAGWPRIHFRLLPWALQICRAIQSPLVLPDWNA